MTSQHVTEAEPTLNQLIQSIEEGLPISAFKKLQDSLDLPDKDLAKYVRIPKSTLALRKKEENFHLKNQKDFFGCNDYSKRPLTFLRVPNWQKNG